MNIADYLAPDFKAESYWWRAARPVDLAPVTFQPAYDVAVVGSGFTGLRAALRLARGGARVIVLEKDGAGFGASRRNAGFLGRTLKKTYSELKKGVGPEYAKRVYQELDLAFQETLAFVEAEGIACYANRCGRFIAANSENHQASLIAEMQAMKDDLGWDYRIVGAGEVASEMGSTQYCGGVVVPELGSIHSGLYHAGLVELALAAGVEISTQTIVHGHRKADGGHVVETSRGTLRAGKVVIASNGYTPRELKWHSRRVIPFTGFMAATEELPAEVMAELIPHGRTVLDARTNLDFFRPAPDSSRLLFGGSTGSPLGTTEEIGVRLLSILHKAYPQLAKVKLSAIWSGECAATFDLMPHIGCEDGVYFGLGYNFAGVPMGSYFGDKIADAILGESEVQSVFGEKKLYTLPGYNGSPWFVPLAMKYFDWKDDRLARA